MVLSACGKDEPAEVASATIAIEPAPAPVRTTVYSDCRIGNYCPVNLVTNIGVDQKVVAAATSFSNDDVIYAAVDVKNVGKGIALAIK